MNVLVTGGARGIGAGIVRKLAEQGANVAFCGRGGIECAESFLAELRSKFNGRFEYYQCDISNSDGRNKLLDDFSSDFGGIDMLVNNAGVAPEVRADITEMSEESFDRVMNINLKGPFFLTQAVAKRMIADGRKEHFRCIVNVGSISADVASISRGEYCLSKAGVSMATKLWAVRLAEMDIPVYEIRPGVIKTDMTKVVTEKYDKLIADGLTLQKRWGFPDDIGRAVAAIASGLLAYSTGQVINVDGGMTIGRL
ncbi:MAG: 3-ketoacyl-ACP reductase [Lentisphaeria bacterium]|nr:3-ketoacyl-ACP reductase [Lentisphaeria bacterium]